MKVFPKHMIFCFALTLISCDEQDATVIVPEEDDEFTSSNFRVLERDANNQIIGIQFSNLKYIPSEVLDTLSYLKWMKLSEIDYLTEDLVKLESLESIEFYTPDLESLPESIGLLPRLRNLYFYHSDVESFPSSLIHSNSLESVTYSSYRNPNSLLFDIVNLRNLQELEMTLDTIIPSDISNLKNLKSLEVSGNFELPIEIGDLLSLEELNIRSNNLKSLPTTIGKLQNLRYLQIKNQGNVTNDFDLEIPEELSQCQNLDSIRISVPISSLPDNIGDLTNLSYLYLYNSRLSILPNSFSDLKKLSYVAIIESQITLFPEITDSFRNMKYFFFDSGQLKEINQDFGIMSQLEMLSFRNNSINKIPESIQSLVNLKRLDLRDNPIDQDEIEELKLLLPTTTILF